MSCGFRVVRGPDWCHGNDDGGDGHVGTIITDDKSDKTGCVLWDNGKQTNCSLGKNGKYELLLLDSAPKGIKHEHVLCDGPCIKRSTPILGMRWKCCDCPDYDLCSSCYHSGEHHLNHAFKRIDTPGSDGFKVLTRGKSKKTKAFGIFPGSTVIRGQHWNYGEQDGGVGSQGKVVDLRGYGMDPSARNGIKVLWDNGESNVYRVGCQGKVDVQSVKHVSGLEFYKDHLPLAGSNGQAKNKEEKPPYSRECSNITAASEISNKSFKVGEKVCVDVSPEVLKNIQKPYGNWSMKMNHCIGEKMIVQSLPSQTTVEVEYDSDKWTLNASVLRKIPSFSVGDTVRVLDDKKKVELLQNGHGGWDDEMETAINKVGKVNKIDSDGDVVVSFGQQVWVFNPAALDPAPGCVVNEIDETASGHDRNSDSLQSKADIGEALATMLAQFLLLKTLGGGVDKREIMLAAAAKGDLPMVKKLVSLNPELVNFVTKDLTPLMVASHKGQQDVVKFLIDHNADIDKRNSDGLTALLISIGAKQQQTAEYLLQQGASARAANKKGRSCAHVAVCEKLTDVLKTILLKGGDPNYQDIDGDTPLHDAIHFKNNDAIDLLLRHTKLDLNIKNNRGFTPLMWSALRDCAYATEKILQRDSKTKEYKTKEGFSCLHVAAINNHLDVAKILLKAGLDVNATNILQATPLHLSSIEGYHEMAKFLLEKGANINVQDSDGDTPLHCSLIIKKNKRELDLMFAVFGLSGGSSLEEENKKFKTACLLIEKGASLTTQNKRGFKPFEACNSSRLKEAITKFALKLRPESVRQAQRRSPEGLLSDLFSELLNIPCVRCEQRMSDARLLPCRHKIFCKRCSLRVQRCPICETRVEKRVDMDGDDIDVCNTQ